MSKRKLSQRRREYSCYKKRKSRSDAKRRLEEQRRNTFDHALARQDEARRVKEQRRNTLDHGSARKDEARRVKEQQRNTLDHGSARKDVSRQLEEQQKNTKLREIARQDETYRRGEQKKNTITQQARRRHVRSNWDSLQKNFMEAICEIPENICNCCGGLFYRQSITCAINEYSINPEVLQESFAIQSNGNHHFCGTCAKSMKKGKVPTLCLTNGFQFSDIPLVLKNLSDLEERLLAGRIPFMQLRNLGMDRQYRLVGNIVNVPNDLEVCTSQLPRNLNTIQVMFMRQMSGKSPVYLEVVRPTVVHEAVQYLMSTELYRDEGFVLGMDSSDEEIIEIPTKQDLAQEATEKKKSKESCSETSSEDETNIPVRLDHGIQESMLLPEEEIINMILRIAPGEGKSPLSIVYDDNAEVLSFPRIYGGVKRHFKNGVKISYTDIVKSEARRYDRRACIPTKILWSYKRLLVSRVADAITICLRKKKKVDGTSITAGQLRNSELVANLLNHDDGFRMLRGIRSSPAYWEHQQKKLMAMLRQIGITTIFLTLSAAELRWTELLSQLHYFAHAEKLSAEEVMDLTWEQKVTLIRNDPVTCARHFDNRHRTFLNFLLKSTGGVFNPYQLSEWYSLYEMQQRGSIHSHMRLWLAGAPVFDHEDSSTVTACTNFIDQFITCERFTGDPDLDSLVQYQLHRHARTCRRKVASGFICRFNFPQPPMPATMILEPLPKSTEISVLKRAQNDFDTIKSYLKNLNRQFKDDFAITDFLRFLKLDEDAYILAIRSSIKRTSVFLKKSTNAIFINPYNKKILKMWRANMDIQFVLDEYACARYVASYINKSNGGVSNLLRKANEDIRKGNHSLKERLRMFGNIFNNFTEISAQEAAIGVLGIPLVNCSRADVYINTSVPSERTFILRPKKEIEELPEDSEDISTFSLIDKYVCRHEDMDNVCLADFASLYYYSSKKPSYGTYFVLKNNGGYMAKRYKSLIVRYRRFGKEQDPSNYCREQLMLFLPWRDEQVELLDINAEEKFNSLAAAIAEVKKKYVSKLTDEILEGASISNAIEEVSESSPSDACFEDFSTDVLHDIGGKKPSLKKAEFMLNPKLMSENVYTEKIRTLNKKQRKFILHLVHRIKCEELPFYEFLSGAAGVGKTNVLLVLVQTLLRHFTKQPGQKLQNPTVIVCAPTGKAAFKLHGMTLHHCWHLPPTQYNGNLARLDEDLCNALRIKLIGLKLLIIDEVSMMSVEQLYQVDARLRQIFQSELPFGGKSVLVCGHLRQLEPVGGIMVFRIPRFEPVPYITGNYLWENFKLYELDEIMRQKGDYMFCQALDNMAEGMMTPEDVALIKAREVSEYVVPPDDAIFLFHANADCQAHNEKIHAKLLGKSALSIAHDRIQGCGSELQKQSLLDFAKTFSIGDSDGLPYCVSLKEGAMYFVSTNIDVPDGLFNGSTGTLTEIILATNSDGSQFEYSCSLAILWSALMPG